MKHKSSAALANVLIVEVDSKTGSSETGADKVVKRIKEDLARAQPLIRAAQKRNEAIRPRNEETSLNAKARHQKIREMKQKLGRATRKEIQRKLLMLGYHVSIKQISRALNPKK